MLTMRFHPNAYQWNLSKGSYVQNTSSAKGNGHASIYAALSSASVDRSVSYSQIEGATLRECVTRVTERGDAILFGRTSDGGALSIQVLTGGKAEKFYVSDASELMELITGIIDALTPAS
jgi:hypothetical protein